MQTILRPGSALPTVLLSLLATTALVQPQTQHMNATVHNAPRVLFVLTNHDTLGETGRKTGFYLGELTHAYEVLRQNGFEVDFASPRGGHAPIDGIDRSDPANAAFLDDPRTMHQIEHTLRPDQVRVGDYQAVYFPGGHGTMWDLAQSPELRRLTAEFYESDRPIAAVCHGPAGLVDVALSDGRYLVDHHTVAAFTNAEERAVGLDAVVPYLLQDRLEAHGATVLTGPPFEAKVVVSGNLITGQNPASARDVGHALARALAARSAPGMRSPLADRLQGVQHFGVTVQDMDRAFEFYTEVLGGTEILRDGDFYGERIHNTLLTDQMVEARRRQVNPRTMGIPDLRSGAQRLDVRFIQFDNVVIELLQYRDAEQPAGGGASFAEPLDHMSPAFPRMMHICFHLRDDVDFDQFIADLEAESARRGMTQVRANRVTTVATEAERLATPKAANSNGITEGPSEGWRLIYCKGPEGEQLEFVQALGPVKRLFDDARAARRQVGKATTGPVTRYAAIPQDAIAIVAEVRALPGKEAALRAATLPLVQAVRNEPNNLVYFLHEDRDAPGHFVFYEVFASRDDFTAHNATSHVRSWFSTLTDLADGGVRVVELEPLGN